MINKAHCFFEQSGTFKNEFIKLGIPAEDYDIRNDFGQTDNIIDLFAEIESAYGGGASVFDKIGKDDLIIAFFPCVRFEDQAILILKGNQWQQKNASDLKKLETDLKAHRELHDLYELVTKLAIVAIRNGFRLVIENPYSTQHYLQRYWCLSPAIIDKDRAKSGDYFKKPTQYWFVGFEKKDNFIFEPLEYVDLHTISNYQHSKNNNINGASRKVSRSMIHPQYANRFIREFIL